MSPLCRSPEISAGARSCAPPRPHSVTTASLSQGTTELSGILLKPRVDFHYVTAGEGKFTRSIRSESVFDDRAISVVTGLAGTYMVLSLIVLSLVELISSALSRRARFLRDAVIDLIGVELGTRVLNNPAVSSLGFVRPTGRAEGMPSYIQSNLFARALLAEIGSTPDHQSVCAVKDLITAVVGDPAVSIEEAERRLAAWFDSAMDRLSGAYKRNTQNVSLALAVVITVAANVDSIRLLQALWHDTAPSARIDASVKEATAACQTDGRSPACQDELLRFLKNADDLPMGWDIAAIKKLDLRGRLLWILGLALTVFAVSRGSPFWFDLLRRLSPGMSSSGPKPPPASQTPIVLPAPPLAPTPAPVKEPAVPAGPPT